LKISFHRNPRNHTFKNGNGFVHETARQALQQSAAQRCETDERKAGNISMACEDTEAVALTATKPLRQSHQKLTQVASEKDIQRRTFIEASGQSQGTAIEPH